MERKLSKIQGVLLTLGFALTGVVMGVGYKTPGYLGATFSFSAGLVFTATLVQILQSKRGFLDGGHFSLKRWLIQTVAIVFLVGLIETIHDPEAPSTLTFSTFSGGEIRWDYTIECNGSARHLSLTQKVTCLPIVVPHRHPARGQR